MNKLCILRHCGVALASVKERQHMELTRHHVNEENAAIFTFRWSSLFFGGLEEIEGVSAISKIFITARIVASLDKIGRAHV